MRLPASGCLLRLSFCSCLALFLVGFFGFGRLLRLAVLGLRRASAGAAGAAVRRRCVFRSSPVSSSALAAGAVRRRRRRSRPVPESRRRELRAGVGILVRARWIRRHCAPTSFTPVAPPAADAGTLAEWWDGSRSSAECPIWRPRVMSGLPLNGPHTLPRGCGWCGSRSRTSCAHRPPGRPREPAGSSPSAAPWLLPRALSG